MNNNTNTSDIMSFMLSVASKYNPNINQDTLFLSQFGFSIEIFSKMMQNSIINSNLWAREAFPTLSQMESSIMTNALTYNVKDINATPAKMHILFSILEDDLVTLFPSKGEKVNVTLKEDVVISRKDCKFDIAGFEYHLVHDIIITRTQKKDNTVIYTARYDSTETNPNSDIQNIYINPPKFYYKNNDRFLGIYTQIEQISIEKVNTKVITNNIVMNKTVDFDIGDNMSYFTIDVKNISTGEIQELTPIIEGIYDDKLTNYCKYSYINRNKIRIKFDPESYYPDSGSEIIIEIYTTKGEIANFKYRDEDIISNLYSEEFDYGDVQVLLTPISESYGGESAKSLSDIKKILPREILGRNVITCEADLYNAFNKIDDNIVKFYKRRHNQIDHLYYAYLLSKDSEGNITPTNTVNIHISSNHLLESDDGRYIIPAGSMFKMLDDTTCTIIDPESLEDDIVNIENREFLYSNPINLIVNKDPISTSYYMDIMNSNIPLYLNHINDESINNFIVEYVHVEKIFIESDNYVFTLKATQTVATDMELVKVDKSTGEIQENNVKSIIVIKHDNFEFYVYGELISYDQSKFEYTFKYTLESSKYINKDNKFRLDNIFMGGTADKTSADFPREVEIDFRFYAKFENQYGTDSMIPNIEEYSLMNIYRPENMFALYYNYSNIMTSYCKYDDMSDLSKGFEIKKVPMVKYSYIHNKEKCFKFIDNLNMKKIMMDDMISNIIKPFGVDFKLFNTYGPSVMFEVGHGDRKLDRVNITFEFNVKLRPEAAETIISSIINDIKDKIESLNYIDESIHITNLTTSITNKYHTDIEFIEFVKFNNYDSSTQYLERQEISHIVEVPEFINIDLDQDLNPKIKINII